MERRQLQVVKEKAGLRLDSLIGEAWGDISRAKAQRLIRAGLALVNGRPEKASYRARPGDLVAVEIPPPEPLLHLTPEDIPLDIRYEDEDLVVVNKQQGLVVHPGAGRPGGTLVNALLARGSLAGMAGGQSLRPGVVHRLDKDTSGLMLVAKNEQACRALSAQLKARTLERSYLVLCWGDIRQGELTVDAPIGRHPTERKRMAVLPDRVGRPGVRRAVTQIKARERFGGVTLAEARLVTGRTHQVRVHLAHLGHPVVGDPTYGGRRGKREMAGLRPDVREAVERLQGQALHAFRLSFEHPGTGDRMTFTSDPPHEMARLILRLREGGRGSGA